MTLPTVSIQFSPTTGPFDTPTWIELGDGGPHGNRILEAEWTDGKQADLEEFAPGEATIVLRNDDRLFDPEHASGTYYGDLNPRVPFRIRATYSAVTYDLFYGFVQDGWEQGYSPPDVSTCTVKLVDLLGILAGYRLPGVLEAAIMALAPVAYWPLNDASNSEGVTDKVGNYDGTLDGATKLAADELHAGLGTCAEFDGVYDRIDITRSSVVQTPTTGGSTVMAVFQTDVPADASSIHPIFLQADGNVDTTYATFLHLFVETDGTLRIIAVENGGGWTYQSAAPVDDGQPHLGIGMVGATHYGVAIDSATLNTTSPVGQAQGGNGVAIGGTPFAGRGYDDNYFPGRIGHVAVWDRNLDATERGNLVTGYACLAGETTGAAIEWALTQIGVPASMYDLDAGATVMGGTDTAGRDALEFMRNVATTEQGDLYVAHHDGGKLRFRDRYASFQDTRSTTTQYTFSDDGTLADTAAARVIPGTLQVEPNGINSVINQVSVGWAGGTEIVDESASSPYGPRPKSVDSAATTPAIARGVGQWIVNLNATPRARIRHLGIDPGANHSEFVTALAARIGDRVAYRSIPQNTGSATTKALEVLGRHHSIAGVEWETGFYLAPSPNDGVVLFTLGTSQLGDPDVLAY